VTEWHLSGFEQTTGINANPVQKNTGDKEKVSYE
jgi:hypothetical protein